MKKFAIISTFVLSFVIVSCDSYLDVNEDPNSPSESMMTADVLLPAAEMNLVSSYGDFARITGGYFAQYYVQTFGTSNYLDFSRFTMSATRSSSFYTQITSRSLGNLKTIRSKAKNNEEWGTYLAATTLWAYAYQVLVDAYGEIPYSEAFNTSISSPHYDDGADIYNNIVAELDDALEHAAPADLVATNFLFSGENAANWIKFAKALKLKILSRESGVANVDAQIAALVQEGDFPASDVAYQGCWSNESGAMSPFYAEEFATNWGSTQINVVANVAIIGTMQQKDTNGDVVYSDPRLPSFFEPNGSGEYTGGISGSNFSTSESYKSTYWCRPVASYDMPVYFLTVAETEFFIAEYYAKQNNAAQAEAHYNAAIEASCATAGVDGAVDIIAKFPYDQANYKQSIGVQKWISLAGVNTFEGWCEARRLDAPAFSNVTGSQMYNENSDASYNPGLYVPGTFYTPIKVDDKIGANNLLERWIYPESSSARNGNSPEFPGYTTPIFWGK